ncbi:hypothetical protein RFI_35263, partial [Reticulomyxa filosa]
YLENVCKTSGNRQELLPFLSDLCELKDLREFLEERMARIKKIIEKGDVSGNEEYVSSKSKLHRLYFRMSPVEEILPANVLLYVFSNLETEELVLLPLFRYKKKDNNNNKTKYKLALKEPEQFEWMHKRKERLHLDLDHAQNMVSIKIDNKSGKTNGMEFFNDKNENSIAKFPWHGIRKWEIEDYSNWMGIWGSFVNKNPILLYRSLFDLSFWKAYSFANKMQQKKMKRKLRRRNRCYVMKVLQKWDEDGIRIGQNYVFIDYIMFCPITNIQGNVNFLFGCYVCLKNIVFVVNNLKSNNIVLAQKNK